MPLPTHSPLPDICCEMVKDGPGMFIVLVLIFLALAVIALTGFVALMLD